MPADEPNKNDAAGAEGGAAPSEAETLESVKAELARERREKGNAFNLLRKRDADIRNLTESIEQIRQEVRGGRESEPKAAAANLSAIDPNDPPPEFDANPGEWFKWKHREDQRIRQREKFQEDFLNLQQFSASAEQIARQQFPDYDKSLEWLRKDYRDELEQTGELDEAAFALLQDPGQQTNIRNYMVEHGHATEIEAAREMAAIGAFEWRRQRIVQAQRRRNGNPAVEARKLAERRGYKAAEAKGPGVVDEAVRELERRRSLRASSDTTADVAGAAEVGEKRAWTYDELQQLRQSNPTEFRRVRDQIAKDADDGLSLERIIRH